MGIFDSSQQITNINYNEALTHYDNLEGCFIEESNPARLNEGPEQITNIQRLASLSNNAFVSYEERNMPLIRRIANVNRNYNRVRGVIVLFETGVL